MTDTDTTPTHKTLSGETTTIDHRERPATLRHCAACDEYVLRSEWDDHEAHHRDALGLGRYRTIPGEDEDEDDATDTSGLPEDCVFDTQTYTVEYHYAVVETITVEAQSKADAKEQASHHQDYNGEYVETLHTDVFNYNSEPSQASIDYLKAVGLLPQDYDADTAESL